MPQARGPVFPMGGYSRIEQLLPGRSDTVHFPHHAAMLSFPAITLKVNPQQQKKRPLLLTTMAWCPVVFTLDSAEQIDYREFCQTPWFWMIAKQQKEQLLSKTSRGREINDQGSKGQNREENPMKDACKGRLKFSGKALMQCWDQQSTARGCSESWSSSLTCPLLFLYWLEPSEGYKSDGMAWLPAIALDKTQEVSSSFIFLVQPALDKRPSMSLETI